MRLNILGDDEIEALFGLPHFTHDERVQYFTLTPPETATLEQLHSVASRIYFILQLGYFKARRMFFVFNFPEVEEDVTYIQQQYFPNFVLTALSITKTTRLKHQHLILQLCNYRSCHARKRRQLKTKAHWAAVVCARPVYVFRELVNYMEEQRIVVPGYSFLQD
ncbi:MAG TPA: Tn3 family transposase, partial [Nitrospiraceae bacterium]|nr:Tn3 family transposase [Nitrospiraceae bacterium]